MQTDIRDQMKQAMIAKDVVKLNVLRGLIAAFTNENVAKRRKPDEELTDEDALIVIQRQAKQRKDSIEQFEKGGRPELADAEKTELAFLESYLPAQMSEDEIEEYVKKKIKELESAPMFQSRSRPNASGFMGLIMKELKGKADGTLVKQAVNKIFS